MLSKDEVIEYLKEQNASSIKFAVTDIDGVLRGKRISFEKFLKALDNHIGFCNVIFGWDVNDVCYDNTDVSGWHTGYPDSLASIDINTFRQVPWDYDSPFFLADFSNSDELKNVCPRNLLRSILKQTKELGFLPKFGSEFEWFTFNESPHSLKDKQYTNPTPLTPGMFGYSILRASQNKDYFNDLFELLLKFGIPLEGIHTETGDGVYEACIHYSDLLEAADRAVLFKTAVKEIASKHEVMASFMAKWTENLPGCSGHIHQSLWDLAGEKNLFYGGSNPKGISSLMEQYIAGQLYCLPFLLPMYAPTTNSYKRYVEGSWAATSISWGFDNRTTALRIITPSKDASRIENRVPGSDANPYLTMAASLASGLYGVKNQLELNIEPTKGNEYENASSKQLPKDLNEATQAMKNSEIPKQLFGEAFVDHFIKTREWEWRQYDPEQPNWEIKRYFEII